MKQQLTVLDSIKHISVKPWSDFTKADYTLEQWHAACLIHLHDGPPTSKSECKLPIKTPNGAINRNGVHAAASVLAGGRGGVNAPSEKTSAAARALKGVYAQLGEKPPPSLVMRHTSVESVLEHHGVLGMKWGRRRSSGGSGGGVTPVSKTHTSKDFQAVQALKTRKPNQLTNKQLKTINDRMNLETSFKRMNPSTIDKGHNKAKKILGIGTTVASIYALSQTKLGQKVIERISKAVMKKKISSVAAFPSPLSFA